MTAVRIRTGIAAAAVGATLAAVLLFGQERLWQLSGDADLGPVAFETLDREKSSGDALACPPGLCRAAAEVTSATYPMPANVLRLAFAKAMIGEPRLERVAMDEAALTERYIQRTPVMGLPDTIAVRFIDLPDGSSTLALHSRPQFARTDFGRNRARLDRWMTLLAAAAAADEFCATHRSPGPAPQRR